MILLLLNEANFEYDIQGLIRAFYPKCNLMTRYTPGAEPKNSAPKKTYNEPEEFRVVVMYEGDKINVSLKVIDFFGEPEMEDSITIEVDSSDRKDTKNRLKRGVYMLLSSFSGKTLPWGTLTGIRPTKIPLNMLEEGKSREFIENYMKETYLISDKKLDIALSVATKEHKLLKDIDYDNGYSLYIGIPFCPSTCLYCSFPSYAFASVEGQVEKYLEALFHEIEEVSDMLRGRELTSIYIGGGTPTSLSSDQIDRLLSKVEDCFDLSSIHEFTVEAGRPDSITRDKLVTLKNHGVGRISINPQTMKQETLKLIGRHHTVEAVEESFNMAREVGFNCINMDLILGLPGEDVNDVRNTLERVSAMKPDNLTVHSLALKRSSRLNIEWDSYSNYLMENSDKHMNLAHEYAAKLGLEPYYLYRQKNMAGNLENVGFAKAGLEGLYNVLIMEEKQSIIALGAGSACKYVSCHGKTVTRSENVKDVGEYIERIDEMIERKRNALEG